MKSAEMGKSVKYGYLELLAFMLNVLGEKIMLQILNTL